MTIMVTEKQEQETEQTFNRSSSPFDHQASFIPFPCASPPPSHPSATMAIPEDLKAPEIQTRSLSQTLHRHKAVTEKGMAHLAESMDYRPENIGMREAHLILADALTLIEKLTAGSPITKRPRDLQPWQVKVRLQTAIPDNSFKFHGSGFSQDATWKCDQDTLAEAASNFIRTLKERKKLQRMHSMKIDRVVSTPPSATHVGRSLKDGEDSVVGTLTIIEAWCDDWLNGEIAQKDWDKMDQRL